VNPYPDLIARDIDSVSQSVEEMIKERRFDVKDYDNLQNRFLSGRKVGKIPTGATDVTSLDKAGDFNIAYDGSATYLYALVNISGNAEWRRVALSSW